MEYWELIEIILCKSRLKNKISFERWDYVNFRPKFKHITAKNDLILQWI